MNVMLVSPLPPPSGGMATWTTVYLKHCNKYNIEYSHVNTAITSKRAMDKKRYISLFDETKRTFSILFRFICEKKRNRPDLIHICSSCTDLGLVRDWICTVLSGKTPILFHCHCNIEDQASSKLSRIILRRIVHRSKMVVVLNSASKKIINTMEDNKAIIIPNFIEDNNVRLEHTISQQVKNVVYVGHVRIKKGISEIFMAASKCKDKEFIIVGPIQELPKGVEQPSNVMLIGEVNHDQVASFMETADVFLFPSYTEGFANVMLEAMASGLPIIASDVGANKDMISDQGGIIIPQRDCQSIVAALTTIEDPETRRKMSAWNINKVQSCYTLNKVIPIIKKCYEESV